MEKLETSWRFMVTGLAVWRLSRLLMENRKNEDRSEATAASAEDATGLRFWTGRAADLACWITVWMSSQTAIWVTCGLAGVFVSWLATSGLSRLLLRETETPRLLCGDGMRVRNG